MLDNCMDDQRRCPTTTSGDHDVPFTANCFSISSEFGASSGLIGPAGEVRDIVQIDADYRDSDDR
jgi:hypothetical protein